MSLTKNAIENIATNNCYLYNCHELHQELKQIIEKHNGKKIFLFIEELLNTVEGLFLHVVEINI